MSDPVLCVEDLHVTFPGSDGDVRAVRGVSYELRRGEILGIVGESGSGKSAGAEAVMGLLPPSAAVTGSVRLEGEELLGLGDRGLSRVRGERISMIFQDPLSALTPVYTVGDQIAEAIRAHHGVSREAAGARAVELLEQVGIPQAARRAKAFPHEFSGGMRQRVMIAMAIVNDPAVLICDEPTTALDVTVQAQILDLLLRLREDIGMAILMITHDLGVIAGFADRVAVMYAGRLVESGPVDAVFERPTLPYTLGLLGAMPRVDATDRRPLVPIAGAPPVLSELPPGCPFAPRCPAQIAACAVEPDLDGPGDHRAACHRAGELRDGHLAPADVFPVPEAPPAVKADRPRDERPVAIGVEDLVKHHPLMKGSILRRQVGTVYAVDGVSFDVREGETLGLVGESGCGKTTTLLEILELQAPQAGRIVVLGHDAAALDGGERRRLRRDIQVVFQDPMASLDPRMPIGDVLREPLDAHDWDDARITARIHELLELVGLEPGHAARFPHQFSGGQRQRISIARALALEPSVLVLDEPVSALDVSIRAGVINLLAELRARLGLSYLFVAHDLSVVRHIADRVAVMYLGRIAEIGDVDRVYGSPAHPYTQALLSAIPIPDPVKERSRQRILLDGDLPSPTDPPSGCRFRTRCPTFARIGEDARRRCVEAEPQLVDVADDQRAACHYAERVGVI